MLYQLDLREYARFGPLLCQPQFAFVGDAMIAGHSPARAWVDDPRASTTALIWDGSNCLYLAGSADTDSVIADIAKLFASRILPEMHSRRQPIFKAYYTSTAWVARLPAIFAGIDHTEYARTLFVMGQPAIEGWRNRIPAGSEIRRIDGELLSGRYVNSEAVREEIESCWPSLDDFMRNGFGFSLVEDREILGWCTCEYLSGRQCGIGVETVEAHQHRGVGRLTASALVEHCIQNGITPHWDSWTANTPSVALARRIGFVELAQYTVHLAKVPLDRNFL